MYNTYINTIAQLFHRQRRLLSKLFTRVNKISTFLSYSHIVFYSLKILNHFRRIGINMEVKVKIILYNIFSYYKTIFSFVKYILFRELFRVVYNKYFNIFKSLQLSTLLSTRS